MTLKEIRDQIIIDAMIAGHPMYPPLRLNNMINQAQRYVQTELNGLGMKNWETYATLSNIATGTWLTSNDISTAPISDMANLCEGPKSIRFIQTLSGSTRGYAVEKSAKEFDEFLRNSYLAPTIQFPIFSRESNYVQIAPAVTSAVAYYYKVVADLSDDSDVTEIPDEFIEQVIKKVVAEIDNNEGRLQDKELQLKQIKQDVNDAFQKYMIKSQVRNDNK